MKTKPCFQLPASTTSVDAVRDLSWRTRIAGAVLFAACVGAGYSVMAQVEENAPSQTTPPALPTTVQTTPATTSAPPTTTEPAAPTTPVALTPPPTNCPNGINLNFRNAPIDLV